MAESTSTPGTVLVVGGSGYLGQFLIADLVASGKKVAFTYNSNQVPAIEGAQAFKVDLITGAGLQECFNAITLVDSVINCAAQAIPAACEADPEGSRAVNIPTQLLAAMERYAEEHGRQPFLVHISTDHVYDGTRAYVKEGEHLVPVNLYGRGKLDAEELVQQRWPQHAILRPSIIYGPPPPQPIRRGLFLQSVEANLSAKKPSNYFTDEWRTPTYVKDLVRVCREVLTRRDALPTRVLNVGGPQRLCRLDMALALAEVLGQDPSLVLPGSSADVPRTCATPADISMDCTALEQGLGVQLTPFKDGLREIFQTGP